MDVASLLARRRVTRSFDGSPVDPAWLQRACETALLAPTAGHSAGVSLSVIGRERVGEYLEVATDPSWRARSSRYAGWARAGALVLVSSRVSAYLERYAEPDKADAGLSVRDAWPVPYWHGDAAMATMALLLLIEEAGLAAGLWGAFRNVEAVRHWAGLADDELFATIFVGRPDGRDRPSASLARPVPPRAQRVRRLD
ncbi:MAG TPA: nitroreductase family protein [Acidimicrobiales bacterium]|nr:nitroreductase family protein [Acidimicrobiales bacterium]